MIRINLTKTKKENAQGMVEFALILPILMMLMLGIVEFGRLIFVYASVTSASREGARYGSAVGDVGGVSRYLDCDGIRNAALKAGQFAGLELDDISIQYDDGTAVKEAACPPTERINLADRVVVSAGINFQPIVPLIDIFFPEDGFDINSTTARTIIKEVAVKGTPIPTNTPRPVVPDCYVLILNHTGEGENPTASPTNSDGCPLNQYSAGTSITLSAVPEMGWEVSSWTGTGGAESNIFKMPANDHISTVNYTQICYTLTLSNSTGGSPINAEPANSVDCSPGGYHANETIDLTAAPDENWEVESWNGTDDPSSTEETSILTMPFEDHEVTLVYTEICYTLIVSHTGKGTNPFADPANSAGCPTGYQAGEEIQLRDADPDDGWVLSSWTGTNATHSNVVTMPGSDHEVIANYTQEAPPPTPIPPCPSPGSVTSESKKLKFRITNPSTPQVYGLTSVRLSWPVGAPELKSITFSTYTQNIAPAAPPSEYVSNQAWSGTFADQEEMTFTFLNNLSSGQTFAITVQFQNCPAVSSNYTFP
jgi:hypothetical protein